MVASITAPVRAVVAVVLGVVVGVLTNLITSRFSWALLAGLLVVLAAWLILVWWDAATTQPERARIDITARQDSQVTGNRIQASGDAVVVAEALDQGNILRNDVTTDGPSTTLRADHATIQENDVTGR